MANPHGFQNVCGLGWHSAGSFSGTGFLVGPRHVLTCGHNLFDPRYGGDSKNLFARFAGEADGNEENIPAVHIQATDQWCDKDAHSAFRGLSAFDVGFVLLAREPANGALANQTFGFDLPAVGQFVAMGGYPSRGVPPGWSFNEFQVGIGPLYPDAHPNYGGRIYYQMFGNFSVLKGMSGGPVWRIKANGEPLLGPDGRAQVVGIQTSFDNFGDGLESGVTITQGLIDLVNEWIAI